MKPNNQADVAFRCCPDRKANIYICSQCESIYHHRCARKLSNIKSVGRVKADCCSTVENGTHHEEVDNKSLSENVEELKRVVDELKDENHNLKDQISSLNSQHIDIITTEITLKNSEQNVKMEKLVQENELLKQLNQEIKDNNELLKEKNHWLSTKLDKKKRNQWVKKNLGKVLKKRRKKPSNTIEPVEI